MPPRKAQAIIEMKSGNEEHRSELSPDLLRSIAAQTSSLLQSGRRFLPTGFCFVTLNMLNFS